MADDNRNIEYRSEQIPLFYSRERTTWEDFYPSERRVLEEVGIHPHTRIIDVGCACGGLGAALRERFGLLSYTGVDLSLAAIEIGRSMHPWQDLHALDFLDLDESYDGRWDLVSSLSCFDWNVESLQMLARIWALTAPGGDVVVSARLTSEMSRVSINESFQFVNFDGKREGERAPYVVFNSRDLLNRLTTLQDLEAIYAYGYWGTPSATAVTPFDRVVFAVFRLSKRLVPSETPVSVRLEVPGEVL